jgi:hypothetical protein
VFLDLVSAVQNRGLGCGLFQNRMLVLTVDFCDYAAWVGVRAVYAGGVPDGALPLGRWLGLGQFSRTTRYTLP